MAFSGFASAANIGSFVLQAVSFGQCTMNKHNKIESRLSKAIDHLKVAMDQLRKYSEYLDDEEFNESMNKCQSTINKVVRDLKTDAACKSFLVAAKAYQASKNSARGNLIASIEAEAEILAISTKAKRRADVKKQQMDKVDCSERPSSINQTSMGSTHGTSIGADPTHSLETVAAPRVDDDLTNPFRDALVSKLNSIKEEDIGDIPLQHVECKPMGEVSEYSTAI